MKQAEKRVSNAGVDRPFCFAGAQWQLHTARREPANCGRPGGTADRQTAAKIAPS